MDDDCDKRWTYHITVQGRLDQSWSRWFDGLAIEGPSRDSDLTTLTGPVVDQPALRGLLNKLWDLNLTLIAVRRAEQSPSQGQAMTPEIRRKIISWIRGAFFGMIGYSLLLILA